MLKICACESLCSSNFNMNGEGFSDYCPRSCTDVSGVTFETVVSLDPCPGAYRAVGHGGARALQALGGGHWGGGGTAVGVPTNTLIRFV